MSGFSKVSLALMLVFALISGIAVPAVRAQAPAPAPSSDGDAAAEMERVGVAETCREMKEVNEGFRTN